MLPFYTIGGNSPPNDSHPPHENQQGIITEPFIKELERLKNNTRTAWTSKGRKESIAEHSFRLAMFILVLEDYFPDLDFSRVLCMALVHDLGEAYEGDISAKIAVDPAAKLKREEEALIKLTSTLPDSIGKNILELCREYNMGITREARLIKALDKIETIIQHNQGANPPDFDYVFNLEYGKKIRSH